METVIAVILAILIVAGVFIAAICIALMKKSKDGQKTSRTNTGNFSTRNNLANGNSNVTPRTAPNIENNAHPIGVFHIHVNTNSRNNPVRQNINHTQKTVPEAPPPSYFELFPQQPTTRTEEYQHEHQYQQV